MSVDLSSCVYGFAYRSKLASSIIMGHIRAIAVDNIAAAIHGVNLNKDNATQAVTDSEWHNEPFNQSTDPSLNINWIEDPAFEIFEVQVRLPYLEIKTEGE
jgi:hypothetical protein